MDLNRMCDEVLPVMSHFSRYTEHTVWLDTITALAMFNVQFIYFLRRGFIVDMATRCEK